VYSPRVDRLIYLQEKATPEFWEARWEAEGKPPPPSLHDEVVMVTRRYLRPGARLLEGGCGRADKVKSLTAAGYASIGIDFASGVVAQARIDYPGIDVRLGDVRALEFPDRFFDGYWSIGVIEHFWDGYDAILAEAARVLRAGGIFFLTAPWISPYRRRRVRSGDYPVEDFSAEPVSFYQFALGRSEVVDALERHGFRILRWRGSASEISMQEDMPRLKRQIDWLLGSRGSIIKRVIRKSITRCADPYCGHSFMAIARREGAGHGVDARSTIAAS